MSENYLDNVLNEDGCPKCNSLNVKPVSYTWWGGIIGPRILKHTKCNDCKFTYNRKTRQSNTTPIVIYSVVTLVLALAVVYFVARG
jgi:transposase-like protein